MSIWEDVKKEQSDSIWQEEAARLKRDRRKHNPFLYRQNVETLLPPDERGAMNEVLGILENPDELRDDVATSLYLADRMGIEPNAVHLMKPAIVARRYRKDLSPSQLRRKLQDEDTILLRDSYATELKPFSLFGQAFVNSLATKPATAIKGITPYTPGEALGLDKQLKKTSQYMASIPSLYGKAQVEKAAAGRLWPIEKGAKWHEVKPELVPETVNAWAANIGDQIPIMLMTWAGRVVGKVTGKPLGALAGVAYAMATAGPDPHDVAAAPAIARITGKVIEHTGGAAPLVALETGAFLDRAEGLGIDQDIAEKYARQYGPGSGVIEYAQWLWNLKAFRLLSPKVKMSITKRIAYELVGEAWEGLEEWSQQGLENYLIGKAVDEMKGRHPEYDETAPAILAGGGRAFALGVGVSFVTRMGGHATSRGLDSARHKLLMSNEIQAKTDATKEEADIAAEALASGGPVADEVAKVIQEQVKEAEKVAEPITPPELPPEAAKPSEAKEPVLHKNLIKTWLPKIKTKLIEMKAKDLSDAELERAFKGTVAEDRLIEYSKLMRESGDLKYSEIRPSEAKEPSIVRAKYNKASLQSATEAVKRTNPNEDRYIYATAEGFVIDKNPPIDKNQSYRVVHPDYSYEDVQPFAEGEKARVAGRRKVLQERVRRGEPTPESLLREFKAEKWAQEALAEKPPAKPSEERQKDLIGRPLLEGGARGPQAEFLDKEKYRLPEPDIEGQMVMPTGEAKVTAKARAQAAIGIKEAALVETGMSDKQRTKHIRNIEKQIVEHPIYQKLLEAEQAELAKFEAGTYFVPEVFRGEAKDAIQNYPALKFHITYDPKKGKHWDEGARELLGQHRIEGVATEHIDISEFLERLGRALEGKKKIRGLVEPILEGALEEGDPEIQILADIRYGLETGKSVQQINANTREWAEHYDLTEDDISDIILPELTDEQVKAEREKARAEDEALEKLEAERLREKEAKTRAEQERLKEIVARQEATAAEAKTKKDKLSSLRQQIHAVAAKKGLTKKALTELKKKHTGYNKLTGKIASKKITVEQLENLLKAVEKQRPKQVGHRKVITRKTENKIQSLKDALIKSALLRESDFADILEREIRGKEPAYIDAKNFITETQGKDIIKRIHDTAEVKRATEKYERAIDLDPEIAHEVNKLDETIKRRSKRDPYSLESMRYYNQQAEIKTGAPIFSMYMDLIDTHLEVNKTRHARLKTLEAVVPDFRAIASDNTALHRVSNYIASQSYLKEKPSMPKNITANEKKVAQEIQKIFKEYELKARVGKFFNYYYYNDPIPNAPAKELTKAVDIFEGQGKDALIDYLKTQTWGVIKSGYEPLEILRERIKPYKPRPTAVGKGHINIRTDIQYHDQERNILQRLASYMRQMDLLYNMSPKINAFVRLYDDNMATFNKPGRVARNVELFLRNLKRYNIQGEFFERGLARLYSQAMRVIIMPSPVLSFRNLFQNAAFEHDKSILFDLRNKSLTDKDIDYLETYSMQQRAMIEEYFMLGEKPLPGLAGLTALIDKIKIYPHSDVGNRHWGFWAKKNQVDRAFAETGPLAAKMKAARFADMTELEQRRALGILAADGQDAMARYVSRVHVDDIHFLYERSQRSPAEMGPIGRIMGNLMLFPRAYGEKLAHAMRKLTSPVASQTERSRAAKILVNVIVGGYLVGSVFTMITGRKRNPYNPFEILKYEVGGLAWGAIETINKVGVNSLTFFAWLWGLADDESGKRAMNTLSIELPRAADMFIPFYDYILRIIEASTDAKNLDRKALRQLRELVDKEYEHRPDAYKMKRNFIERLQYIVAGPGVDVKIEEKKSIRGKSAYFED